MENINESISKNLKNIRKEKGLTLDDLADISGVSKSMLGEIERGSTNPTILVLWKIADGLKIPLTHLMSEEQPEYILVKAAAIKPVNQGEGHDIYGIFPYTAHHQDEILRLEIAAHAGLSNPGHLKGIDEFIYVLRGRVRFLLDKKEFSLEEDDSIRFKGDLPHAFYNDGEEEVSLLNILYYPIET